VSARPNNFWAQGGSTKDGWAQLDSFTIQHSRPVHWMRSVIGARYCNRGRQWSNYLSPGWRISLEKQSEFCAQGENVPSKPPRR
jgi:hypothetical protein